MELIIQNYGKNIKITGDSLQELMYKKQQIDIAFGAFERKAQNIVEKPYTEK